MPLSGDEERTLKRLLDRRGVNLPAAQAERDRERAREQRLEEERNKVARAEERRNNRLAELKIDLDVVASEIFAIAPSGVAFRHVSERLQALGKLIPTQSYFGTQYDTMDRNMIRLLAEDGLDAYVAKSGNVCLHR